MIKLSSGIAKDVSVSNYSFVSIGNTSQNTSTDKKTDKFSTKSKQSKLISSIQINYLSQATQCFWCEELYKDLVKCETHQLCEQHMVVPGRVFNDAEEWCLCRKCDTEVLYNKKGHVHHCTMELRNNLLSLYNNLMNEWMPLYCLICKGVKVKSIGELICHLICYHSDNIFSFYCSICSKKFRSDRPLVKLYHMLSEHCDEMELELIKSRRLNFKTRTFDLFDKFDNPFICIYLIKDSNNKNNNKLHICGMLFPNLVTFTTHILCYHCVKPINRLNEMFNYNYISMKNKFIMKTKLSLESTNTITSKTTYSNISSIYNMTVECTFCHMTFDDNKELNIHSQLIHLPSIKRSYDYRINRGHFKHGVDLFVTCAFCVRTFDSPLEKQIHLLCRHFLPEWNICGLCNETMIDLDHDSFLSNNIVGKIMKTHEALHTRKINNFIHKDPDKSPLLPIISNKPSDDAILNKRLMSIISRPSILSPDYSEATITTDDQLPSLYRQTSKQTKKPLLKSVDSALSSTVHEKTLLFNMPISNVETPKLLPNDIRKLINKKPKSTSHYDDIKSRRKVLPRDIRKHLASLGAKNRAEQEALELFY